MNAMIVGKDQEDLILEERLAEMPDMVIVGKHKDEREAQKCLQTEEIDLVILYEEQSGINSQRLGEWIAEQYPQIIVLYITDSGKRLEQMLHQRHAMILLRPYTSEEAEDKLELIRLLYQSRRKRIYARTFGYFDLFLDGKPMVFKSGKAKELLALLIDRKGGTVDTDQIIAALWNDRPRDELTQSLCSKLCKTLQKELKGYGIEDLMVSSRNSRYVNIDLLDCDLYDLQDGKEEAKKLYYGEYMTDYAWAEYRNYSLSKYM